MWKEKNDQIEITNGGRIMKKIIALCLLICTVAFCLFGCAGKKETEYKYTFINTPGELREDVILYCNEDIFAKELGQYTVIMERKDLTERGAIKIPCRLSVCEYLYGGTCGKGYIVEVGEHWFSYAKDTDAFELCTNTPIFNPFSK